ncbi:MAG: hypothetical protein ACKOOE_08705 [Micrococcales bacterium]
MKNNTLAMLATISVVFSFATLIGYIDPAVCAGSGIQSLDVCTLEANTHLIAFATFFSFGALTLLVGFLRSRSSKSDEGKA